MPYQAVDPVKITELLRARYTAKINLTLLIPQEYKEIPIEQLYTRLAIIRETEQKDKKEHAEKAKGELGSLGYGITPTHEAIFEPKDPVKLKNLFGNEDPKRQPQKRILIQGSAGIGKSTLCHHIAYRWAKGDLFQEFEFLFWLPLRNLNKDHYGHECSIESYLAKECQLSQKYVRSFLSQLPLREKTLILLDGYDELSPDAVNPRGALNPILNELKRFSNVLITTRPQYVDFNHDCNYEILGFDAKGVQEYISQFFSEGQKTQTQQQKDQAKDLRTHLKNPLARSLARIPINLEIFCSLVAAGEPLFASAEASSITSLYIRLTDWLFKRFRIERNQELNDPNVVIDESDARHASDVDPLAQALEDIAWEAMKQNTLYIPEPQITHILRSIERKYSIKDATRIGPLRIENKEGVFIHLTFQEFFAAAKLARLYKTDPKQARECLTRIKFVPRYTLVLKMVAGHLSMQQPKKPTKEKTLLQTFFDDLFSEPHDLAVSYGLRLQALCFEECEKPESVSQYNEFVKQVVNFLNTCPNQQLIIHLLTGNSQLIGLKAILQVFENQIQDSLKRKKILDVIRSLVNLGQPINQKVLEKLVSIFPKSEVEELDKYVVIWSLKELAKSDQFFPKDALNALEDFIEDRQTEGLLKVEALGVLETIARSDQLLAQDALNILKRNDAYQESGMLLARIVISCKFLATKALQELKSIVYGSNINKKIKFEAAQALVFLSWYIQRKKAGKFVNSKAILIWETVDSGNMPLTSEILSAFSSIITGPDFRNHYKYRRKATRALINVANTSHSLAGEALINLIQIITKSSVSKDIKSMISKILVKITRSDKSLTEKIQEELISHAYRLHKDIEAIHVLIEVLEKIIMSNIETSEKAIKTLTSIMSQSETSEGVKYTLAKILLKISKKHRSSAEMILNTLILTILNNQTDWDTKSSIALVLQEIAKRGKHLAKDALSNLIAFISDSNNDTKSIAAEALVEVAKSNNSLAENILNKLIAFLPDSNTDNDTKAVAAKALAEIGKDDPLLIENVLEVLTKILSGQNISNCAKSIAAEGLEVLAMNGKILTRMTLEALVSAILERGTDWIPKYLANNALKRAVINKQSLLPKDIKTLISVILDLNTSEHVKFSVTGLLTALIANDQYLPQDTLVEILTTASSLEQANSTSAKEILQAVLSGFHPLIQKVGKALLYLACSPKKETSDKATETLKRLLTLGKNVPMENIRSLILFIFSVEVEEEAKFAIAQVLIELANNNLLLHEDVKILLSFVDNLDIDSSDRFKIASTLLELVKNDTNLLQEVVLKLSLLIINYNMHQVAELLTELAIKTPTLAQEVLKKFIDLISNPQTDSDAIDVLVNKLIAIAKSGQQLAQKVWNVLINSIKDPNRNATELNGVLVNVAEHNLSFATEDLKIFTSIILDLEVDQLVKSKAFHIISKANNVDWKLIPNIFEAIKFFLSDLKIDNKDRLLAIHACKMAVEESVLPEEVLEALINIACHSSSNTEIESSAVDVLEKIVESAYGFPKDALQQLIKNLGANAFAKKVNNINRFLENIIEKQSNVWTKSNYKDLIKIYLQTGYALYYRKCKLYVLKKHGKVCLGEALDILPELESLRIEDLFDRQ